MRSLSGGLRFGNQQGTRRTGSNRLAYLGFTRSLMINDKLPIDDLEHSRKGFDTVCCMDADLRVVGDVHGGFSWSGIGLPISYSHSYTTLSVLAPTAEHG